MLYSAKMKGKHGKTLIWLLKQAKNTTKHNWFTLNLVFASEVDSLRWLIPANMSLNSAIKERLYG